MTGSAAMVGVGYMTVRDVPNVYSICEFMGGICVWRLYAQKLW